MAATIRLRDDFDLVRLRGLPKGSRDLDQRRRLLFLGEIYDGGSRCSAPRIDDDRLQTARNWVLSFNAGGPKALVDLKPPAKATKVYEAQRQAPV